MHGCCRNGKYLKELTHILNNFHNRRIKPLAYLKPLYLHLKTKYNIDRYNLCKIHYRNITTHNISELIFSQYIVFPFSNEQQKTICMV